MVAAVRCDVGDECPQHLNSWSKHQAVVASASISVVVSTLILSATGVGFDPRPCHHVSVWDVLITTSDPKSKKWVLGHSR